MFVTAWAEITLIMGYSHDASPPQSGINQPCSAGEEIILLLKITYLQFLISRVRGREIVFIILQKKKKYQKAKPTGSSNNYEVLN